jgi:hypothetical protein
LVHLLGGRQEKLEAACGAIVEILDVPDGEVRKLLVVRRRDAGNVLAHVGLLGGARPVLFVLPWLLVDSLGE